MSCSTVSVSYEPLPVLALALLLACSIIATASEVIACRFAGMFSRIAREQPDGRPTGPCLRHVANELPMCGGRPNCTSCSVLNYNNTRMGVGGFKRSPNPGSCGNNDLGTCNANLACVPNIPSSQLAFQDFPCGDWPVTVKGVASAEPRGDIPEPPLTAPRPEERLRRFIGILLADHHLNSGERLPQEKL